MGIVLVRNKQVHVESHQFCCQFGQSIQFPFAIAVFNDDVLSLHVATFTKPLPECLDVGRVGGLGVSKQNADPRNLPRRLRLGGERCDKDGENESEDQPDRLACHPCLFFKMNP